MSIFRSEVMLQKRLHIPRQTCLQILNQIGKLNDAIEFIDLEKDKSQSNRAYSAMVSRCDHLEKIFIKFENICDDHNVPFIKYDNYNTFLRDLDEEEAYRTKRGKSEYFDVIENEVIEDYKKIEELIEAYENIKRQLTELIEKKTVFKKAGELFKREERLQFATPADENNKMLEMGYVSDLNYLAGVAKADDEMKMKRMIFRVSKGRAIPHFFHLERDEVSFDKVLLYVLYYCVISFF